MLVCVIDVILPISNSCYNSEYLFFYFIEELLIYNILVSGVHHSDCIFKASVQLKVITKMCAQSLSLI